MNISISAMSETEPKTDAKAEKSETTTTPFTMKSVKKKPSRSYRKGSMYDPILDAFIKGTDKLVNVTVKGKTANYLRTQLNNRISARKITDLKVSVVNDVLYLEKK